MHILLRIVFMGILSLVCLSQTAVAAPMHDKADYTGTISDSVNKVSIKWTPIAGAVQYRLNITDKTVILKTVKPIYAAGCELDVKDLSVDFKNLDWQVQGLDYNGAPVSEYSKPEPLSNAIINSDRPIATTQFDKMKYTPVYPTYSWIPYLNAAKYAIRVYHSDSGRFGTADTLLHEYKTDTGFDFYDPSAYVKPGQYYWTIQARNVNDRPISHWSKPIYFSVINKNIITAALGDSITHGGGAISTPPGYLIYDWQTYCPVPVLNIGYSGDTTSAMLKRFTSDVLPFKPQVLVIMGGVNDIRTGITAQEVINNLSQIRQLCIDNNIIPVLVTVTPVEPAKMQIVGRNPPDDWQSQLNTVNNWIMSYKNSIDVASLLTDNSGLLRNDFTTDGLHPDMIGKEIIGSTIGQALLKNYPDIYSK
jgi:lysophospholipase L1-like esterase